MSRVGEISQRGIRLCLPPPAPSVAAKCYRLLQPLKPFSVAAITSRSICKCFKCGFRRAGDDARRLTVGAPPPSLLPTGHVPEQKLAARSSL